MKAATRGSTSPQNGSPPATAPSVPVQAVATAAAPSARILFMVAPPVRLKAAGPLVPAVPPLLEAPRGLLLGRRELPRSPRATERLPETHCNPFRHVVNADVPEQLGERDRRCAAVARDGGAARAGRALEQGLVASHENRAVLEERACDAGLGAPHEPPAPGHHLTRRRRGDAGAGARTPARAGRA